MSKMKALRWSVFALLAYGAFTFGRGVLDIAEGDRISVPSVPWKSWALQVSVPSVYSLKLMEGADIRISGGPMRSPKVLDAPSSLPDELAAGKPGEALAPEGTLCVELGSIPLRAARISLDRVLEQPMQGRVMLTVTAQELVVTADAFTWHSIGEWQYRGHEERRLKEVSVPFELGGCHENS